jgi:hypothetical protein
MDPSAVSFNSGGARRGGGGAQIWMRLVVLETPIA